MSSRKPSVIPLVALAAVLLVLAGTAYWYSSLRESVPGLPAAVKAPASVTSLNAYFSNTKLDPAVTCELVFPVERAVTGDAGPEQALKLLLAGPTPAEKALGYFSDVPDGVALNSVTVDGGGIARADFSDALDRVAGSCSVTAIRAEIESTLKQFPPVLGVVISISGRTEGVLQP